MKTTAILILMILTLSSYGQLGVHFADSNAIWKTNYRWLPPSPFGYNGYAENYISGDTIINNLPYKKIGNTGYDVFCTKTITSEPRYIGALREDTIQMKVLFIPAGEQNDTLLYDYNLQVGDTLPLGYNVIALAGQLYVSSIDTIETNGVLRLRWNLSAEYYGQFASIIEGIGSTNGLLEDIWIFEEDAFLRCYYCNDTLVFLNDLFVNQCEMPTDTCFYLNIYENSNKKITDFTCSPNPVNNRLTISLYDKISENYTLEFYNQLGNKTKTVKITRSEQEINVENLSSGIYYLILKDGEMILNRRKVIKK